jgi:hypothetical protein
MLAPTISESSPAISSGRTFASHPPLRRFRASLSGWLSARNLFFQINGLNGELVG